MSVGDDDHAVKQSAGLTVERQSAIKMNVTVLYIEINISNWLSGQIFGQGHSSTRIACLQKLNKILFSFSKHKERIVSRGTF